MDLEEQKQPLVLSFIMRSRSRMSIITLCCIMLIPWLGSALVGLATLRSGALDGAVPVLATALIFVLAELFGDQIFNAFTIISAALVWALAGVLRSSGHWQWPLLTAMIASILICFALPLIGQAQIQTLIEVMQNLLSQSEAKENFEPMINEFLNESYIGKLIALYIAYFAITALLLARYWQSLMDWRGGFRIEFHRLRLASSVALPLCLLASAALLLDQQLWPHLLTIPLLIAGVSLVHGYLNLHLPNYAGPALFFFYLTIVIASMTQLIAAVTLFVSALAVVDSFANFREEQKPLNDT